MDDLAALQDDGALRNRQRDPCMLLDKDDRHPGLRHNVADDALEVLHDDRRKTFHGLIKQQKARIEHQSAANGEHLLLAARQTAAEIPLTLVKRWKS